MEKTRKQLRLDQLIAHPKNPRKLLTVEDLTDSITEAGQLVPLLVRPFKDGYQIISGHRRREAMQRLGFLNAECDVVEMDDEQAFKALMTTNIQSQSLSEIEEAVGISHMIDAYEWTQERVAREFGKGQDWVSRRLALLGLSETVKQAIMARAINPSQARYIGQLPQEKQEEVATRVVEGNLSSRETADLVRQIIEPEPDNEEEVNEPVHKHDIEIEEPAEEPVKQHEPYVPRQKSEDQLLKERISYGSDYILSLKSFFLEVQPIDRTTESLMEFNRIDEAINGIDQISQMLGLVKIKLINAKDRPEPTGDGRVLEFKRKEA